MNRRSFLRGVLAGAALAVAARVCPWSADAADYGVLTVDGPYIHWLDVGDLIHVREDAAPMRITGFEPLPGLTP